jgi:phosphatidylglycerophosphate synthase
MDLHRTADVPEWELVEADQWNEHQLRAFMTNGWDTPGNRVSAAGFGLSVVGLYYATKGDMTTAAGLLAAGRVLDVVDGYVANATGTKSPKGEMVDASIDKVLLFGALVTLVSQDIIPVPIAIAVGAQNGLNVTATAIAKARGAEIHPVATGKYFTAMQWGGFVLRLAGNALPDNSQLKQPIVYAGDAMLIGGVGVGLVSTRQLFAQAVHKKQDESTTDPAS